ncbi:DUF2079 domain-containing protein [Streptacidiphilus neutrinimicus]|uniref:DUF2079 domain-containing protein n=1 Tax=Streptacidiphilus neutrinimicus TaxID=105420 RepID=UPI001F392041|nr:DUF2079 domain-containing protein [Streptacidiphilus neutrinimicus]
MSMLGGPAAPSVLRPGATGAGATGAGVQAAPDGIPTRARTPLTALPWALTALFAVLYTVVSVRRNDRMLSMGYDLGIFEQAVKAYAHLRAPVVPLKGPGYNLLGDHFHPVLMLLAPAYRLLPTPVTLLVAQALLMALAVLPLARWALAQHGPRAAVLVGCAVGSSWGIVKAVSFDFHEIAFAVPLLAFTVEALGRRRWHAALWWSLPLVLVKEDLGLTVAAVGVYVAWYGRRPRLGLPLAGFGLSATALEVLVVIPSFNPHGAFDYLPQLSASGAGPAHLATHLLWPPLKWLTLLMLVAPTGFLCLRAPLLWLTVPTLLWRFASDNPNYWGVSYHYSAVLMPVVFAAMLQRTPHVTPRLLRAGRRGVAAFACLMIPVYPLHEVMMPEVWQTSAHVRTAGQVLALIPDGATVAASDHLAAQLVSRTTVSLYCAAPTAAGPQWVVVDRTDPTVKAPCPANRTRYWLDTYRRDGYRVRADRDSVILLERGERRRAPVNVAALRPTATASRAGPP